jgi:hypothetical protein
MTSMKKILYLVIGSVFALFILITAVSLVFPAHVRISRAVDIAVPRYQAGPYLQQPAILAMTFPGTSSLTVQSRTDTSMQAIGEGTAAIPMKTGWQLLQASSTTCTLQWYIDFYFDWYPWEKFASLLVEPRYGLLLEKRLKELKLQIEATPTP